MYIDFSEEKIINLLRNNDWNISTIFTRKEYMNKKSQMGNGHTVEIEKDKHIIEIKAQKDKYKIIITISEINKIQKIEIKVKFLFFISRKREINLLTTLKNIVQSPQLFFNAKI